ncbi:MAG: 30S ribosomal protein S5 [Patescibacteria group bacterium]|nr:30S ribosomal protein S5 [Patescibacteria group bacterium]
MRRPNRFSKRRRGPREKREFDRKVVSVRRVAKVRAGAKRLRFSAMVVVGDKKGRLGVGLGRGADTRKAIDKAMRYAIAHVVRIDMINDTVPHEYFHKYGAAKLVLRPAGQGTGIIASSHVRAVMEMAGIKNVLTKQLGSKNQISNTYCAFEALKLMKKDRIMKKRSEKLKSKLKNKGDGASQSEKKNK